MNVTQTRNNAYKKYIIEALNLNNTDYINILLDSFKNEVDILLNNIIIKIQGNSYLEALIINGNLNEAINEIYEKYFNSNLMNYIISKYDNKSLFEEMVKNIIMKLFLLLMNLIILFLIKYINLILKIMLLDLQKLKQD